MPPPVRATRSPPEPPLLQAEQPQMCPGRLFWWIKSKLKINSPSSERSLAKSCTNQALVQGGSTRVCTQTSLWLTEEHRPHSWRHKSPSSALGQLCLLAAALGWPAAASGAQSAPHPCWTPAMLGTADLGNAGLLAGLCQNHPKKPLHLTLF